jgi:hypothetical protein
MTERHYTGFLGKHAIAPIACGVLFILGLSGCKDSQKNSPPGVAGQTVATPDPLSLEGILNRLEGAGSAVHETVRPHTEAVQAKTKEELDKLFRWEYKVVDIPLATDAASLQAQLSALGEENWEVLNMTTTDHVNRIICKRRPTSAIGYLKYIPGL